MEYVPDHFEEITTLIEIKDFSLCQNYDFVSIDIKGKKDLELQVRVYPFSGNGNEVSVYIQKETADKWMFAFDIKCVVCVLDFDGSRRFSKSFSFRNHDRTDVFIFGLEYFCSRRILLDDSADLLPGDVLTLQLDLSYEGKKLSKPILNAGKTLKSMADIFHKPKPADGLLEGWFTIETMHGDHHDIYFEEGARTVGFRLCEASPVFRRMLETPMLEKRTKKIKIIDFDAPTFSLMLHYIQTGSIKWPEDIEDVYSLYEISDKYAILNLVQECSRYLCKKLDVENVIDISKLAIMHCSFPLKKAVSSFFMAKGILVIGKVNIQNIHVIAKRVELRQNVPSSLTSVNNICHHNHLNKHIILVRSLEDCCILYEIADEFKMEGMMQECLRYMKQNIELANIRAVFGLAKRCSNCRPLAFVLNLILQHMDLNNQSTFDFILLGDDFLCSPSSEMVLMSCVESFCIIFELADELERQDVKVVCVEYLKQKIKPGNIGIILNSSKLCQNQELHALLSDHFYKFLEEGVGEELIENVVSFSDYDSLRAASSETSLTDSLASGDMFDRLNYDFYR